jgi:hypothetical protein
MRKQMFASAVTAAAVVAAFALAPGAAAGQTKTPFNPPRTADGQPDLHGYFAPDAPDASHSLEEGAEPENTLGRGRGKTLAQIEEERKNRRVLIVDPAPGPKIPYQPWARAKQRELLDALFTPIKITDIEPEDRCAPMGVPRLNYRFDFEIDQSKEMVTILYSWNHAYRTIPLDGRPHLPASIKLFNGDSRGRWEGNTLVVDVTNLNDQTWFDSHGTIHTDALHVVERWTIVDANTINYQATLDDPKAFTRPWTIAYPIRRIKDPKYELYEEACLEGNGQTIEGILEAGRMLTAKGVKGRHEHTRGFYDDK